MLKQKIVLVGMFVGFMLVTNMMAIMPFRWGSAYYGVLIATFFFLFMEKTGKINGPMFLLYIVGALSIALNDVPTFFKAWQRLGLFVMLTALISPAFMTDKAIQFKTQMFATTNLVIFIATIISIVLFFTGGGHHNIRDQYFEGAMRHSMLMGPTAAMSNLYCLFQLQYPLEKKMKYFYYFALGGGLICVMQTGSRTALIANVMSIMAFMFFRYKERFMTVVRKYIVYIGIAAIASPFWMVYMGNINKKNHGESSTIDTSSRDELWTQRKAEFYSSPIWGIGFSAVDANAESGSTFDRNTGVVETGSSWLCILSMTGILGMGCILLIFGGAVKRGLKIIESSPPVGSYLLSIFVFYIFHMFAEGYIFAGGSYLSAQLWLVLGTIYSISYMPEYGPILEEKLKLNLKFRIPTFLE